MISLVVEAVVRSMALGLMLWVALYLSRSRNPHLHKMLWSTVLLASLAIPFVMRAHVTPVIQAPDYVLTLRGGGGAPTHWSAAWNGASVLYASIALLLFLRYAYSLFQVWRIRRNASVLREVWAAGLDVRATAHISCPATFGSTILLPSGYTEWSAQKLRAVIAHEHSHVLHKDCYVLWLARLHTCLFWINPLAWWLQRRLANSPGSARLALSLQPWRGRISPGASTIFSPESRLPRFRDCPGECSCWPRYFRPWPQQPLP
jgi:hypothetical protein